MGRSLVSGDLLSDELVVRLVVVETANDVFAVRPRVGSWLVFVVAVRFAVVNDVEPVSCPAFPITRRSEQPIHQFFVSVGRMVREEGIHFRWSRRKPGEVEREPTDQREFVRRRRGSETEFFLPGGYEAVD